MGTSIGAAIDWLVAGLPAPLAVIDPIVQVADNQPALRTDSLVVIGRATPATGTASTGEEAYTMLGAQRVEEQYTLPCYAQVYRQGPAQKPARDAVIALFDGIVHFIHADPTFGGLLQMGRIGIVSTVQLEQTQDDSDTGDGGAMRLAVIQFEIAIKNTYIP